MKKNQTTPNVSAMLVAIAIRSRQFPTNITAECAMPTSDGKHQITGRIARRLDLSLPAVLLVVEAGRKGPLDKKVLNAVSESEFNEAIRALENDGREFYTVLGPGWPASTPFFWTKEKLPRKRKQNRRPL